MYFLLYFFLFPDTYGNIQVKKKETLKNQGFSMPQTGIEPVREYKSRRILRVNNIFTKNKPFLCSAIMP